MLTKGKGGVLPMSDMNKFLMQEKHPKVELADEKILITGELPPTLHPVFYDKLDKSLIEKMHIENTWKCRRFPAGGHTLA